MRRSIITVLLVLLLATGVFTAVACTGSEGSGDGTVTDSTSGNAGYSGNDVVSVRVFEFPLTEIYQGEDLFLDGCYLQATTAKGSKYTVPITEDMITGYDKNVPGTQTLTVTHNGKTATVNIDVIASAVQSISFAQLPEDISVVQGSTIDLSGIRLNIHYQATTVTFDGITLDMLRGYSDNLAAGEHTIYIDYYGYTVSFKLTVLPRTLLRVDRTSSPKKTNYFVGEELDMSGFAITCYYDNGTSEVVTYNDAPGDFTVTYDFSTENGYSHVNVEYCGKKISFNCAVVTPTPVSLQVLVSPQTVGVEVDGSTFVSDILHIREGAKIDWATGKASVLYNDGKSVDISLDDARVYLFLDTTEGTYIDKRHSFADVGNHTVFIKYGNSSWATPLYINVEAKKAYKLLVADVRPEVDERVTNKEFVEGQYFPMGYLRYNTLYNNGTYEHPVDEPETWDSLDANKIASDGTQLRLSLAACDAQGYQTVNFTVGGVTAGFRVKVKAKVAVAMEITAPYRNCYASGSEINLEGSSIYFVYNDNTVQTISPIPSEYVKVYYGNNETELLSYEGNYRVVVSAYGKSASFGISAVNDEDFVTSVSFAESSYSFDTVYTFASLGALRSSGIKMLATYKNNDSKIFTLSDTDVEVLTQEKSGRLNVMFRYRGSLFTIKTEIVGRRVSAIEVTGAPDNTVYVAGETDSLDLSGLRITRTYNDGTSAVVTDFPADLWSFTGFDPDTVGVQTVQVVYTINDTSVRTYYSSFDVEVASSAVESISFDEEQPGMESVTSGSVTRNAYKVTFKDDLNTTYLDGDDIGILSINVTYTNGTTVSRPLIAGYLDYDKYVTQGTAGGYFQRVTVTYGGCQTQFWVYVAERELTQIKVKATPDITVYAEGQKLKMEGGYIERIYSNGEADVLPMTSGLIAVDGYSTDPFANVQGGTSISQTVTLSYGGKATTFNITSYRKLEADPKCGNSSVEYGSVTKPTITVAQSIAGFTVPETETEFLIDGEWSKEAPVLPGIYQMRIHVLANEYYNESWVENDSLKFTIAPKFLLVNVESMTKIYGEVDKDIVWSIPDGELVGNDRVELVAYREEGEDVKYTAQGGYGTYAITVKLKDGGQNENALYRIGYGKPTLTIYPKRVEKNKTGNVINVNFITPNNYDKQNGTIQYTGNAIQAFGAQYTDAIGAIVRIAAKDILYYDSNGALLEALPKEKGTYTVKISGNYSFEGTSSIDFKIV